MIILFHFIDDKLCRLSLFVCGNKVEYFDINAAYNYNNCETFLCTIFDGMKINCGDRLRRC